MLNEEFKCSVLIRFEVLDPEKRLTELASFFVERKLCVQWLNLNRISPSSGKIIVSLSIERDRKLRTLQLLENLNGIVSLEIYEGKGVKFK